MVDFSGLDVIKSLKQQGLIDLKNIVILTASSNQELLKEMRNHGGEEIFTKPVRPTNSTDRKILSTDIESYIDDTCWDLGLQFQI